MKIVMKFGGTSVGNGEKILHVAKLLKSYYDKGDQVVMVTSALAGVTDSLLNAADQACREGKVSSVSSFIAELSQKHYDAVRDSIADPKIQDEVISYLQQRIDELEKILVGICYLGELSPRSKDNISSFGERLAAPIVSGAIRSLGVNSKHYTGGEIGMITTDVFGNARPLPGTYERIGAVLIPGLDDSIQVVTGFIGESEDGSITTLGRSGSDYSASIIGVGFGADEIWLWKEVDGIMTANPKVIPSAKTINLISYSEAIELASLGAEVLHPRAIEPAMGRNTPVRVKSTFKPDFEGTLVAAESKRSKNIVKSISTIRRIALINASSVEMVGTAGQIGRLFTALTADRISVRLVSQGSESSISFVVNESDAEKAVRAIRNEFGDHLQVDYRTDVNVVAIVGDGMAGTPGIARRFFATLGERNINIIMISQGSSQYSISCVIETKNVSEAVEALHREYELENVND